MKQPGQTHFDVCTLDQLEVLDEKPLRGVGVYADLKAILRAAGYGFRVLREGPHATWDRAVFLNLTFWGAIGGLPGGVMSGGDVLVAREIPADVVAHAAWHHLTNVALAAHADASPAARPSAEGMFLGEAIASAFDVYLVGRLLGRAPDSSFLESQVPAMADAAEGAGLEPDEFEGLLASIAEAPERAFEQLRELLFDATTALFRATSVEDAARVLESFGDHPFAALIHRYELSNWVLYARAYGDARTDDHVRAIDAELRGRCEAADGEGALAWLEERWVNGAARAALASLEAPRTSGRKAVEARR